MEKLTTKQILDAHLDDWRQLARALHARFRTGDFVTGLTFVTAVTEAAERANHHPDVTLTYRFVDVSLISHDVSQVTQRDIDLARRISEIARAQGIGAEPSALTELELALDTADLDAVARRSGSLRKGAKLMTNVDENIRHLDTSSAAAFEEATTHSLGERASGGSSSGPKAVPHLTPAERTARGKAARGELPRSAHATWEPGPRRRDPIDLLEEQAETRLPELAPIRYGRMLVSPFTFFRGGAYLMAADLADGPRTGLHAQLCGDAHLSNFGIFAAPDRRLVFSINDFDETLPGPFEWDVKRLAASFAVAGRDRGFNEAIRRSVVMTMTREYRAAMARFAEMRNIDVWYARLDVAGIVNQLGTTSSSKQMKRFQTNVAKVRTKDSMRALSKLCRTVDGELRIVGNPPLVTPIEDVLPGAEQDHLENVVRRMIRTYRRTLPRDRRHLIESYRYAHAARKVVGVGSVGARAWILLMIGRDNSDPLFLQFKEAQASVLEPFLGKSQYSQHGQRVVEGQRMMQAAPDMMLGWERILTIDGQQRDFYIRQLWNAKGSAEVELMDSSALEAYGRVCGWTLARAHARSGDRIAIAAYLGNGDAFDRAMTSFAETYAEQNDRDYRALQEAAAAGRVRAEMGA